MAHRDSVPRLSLHDFVTSANPRYQWYRHCDLISDTLERVVSGEIKRLMVFAPPRSGKSELISRLFAPYFLRLHPEKFVAIASYGAELAFDLSRAARRNFLGAGELSGDSKAVKHWETGKGGGMWATGVGGPATGKGFSCGIVDDPLKNAEEAASLTIRNRNRDWWQSVWYTRMEPDAALIVVQTRWNQDDLAGWLLREEFGDDPEGWHVLELQSIYEGPPQLPPSCTLIPDWRAVGEPLVPERFPSDKLRKLRRRLGEFYWAALHQQRPIQRSGSLWSHDTVERSRQRGEALPEMVRIVVAVDPQGTVADSHETGILVCGKDAADKGYVLEDGSINGSPADWGRRAVALYEKWGADTIIAEKNFGGDMVVTTIRAVDRNVPVDTVTASRGKILRAEPVAALYAEDRIRHCGTFRALEEEMTSYSGIATERSPNRLDALVHGLTALLLSREEEKSYGVWGTGRTIGLGVA